MARLGGGPFKQDQEGSFGSATDQGADFDIHFADVAVVAELNSFTADGPFALACFLHGRAHWKHYLVAQSAHQLERSLAREQAHIGTCVAPHVQDLEVVVHHQPAPPRAFPHYVVGFPFHVCLGPGLKGGRFFVGRVLVGRLQHTYGHVRPGALSEELVRAVRSGEHLDVRAQALTFAQQQDAVRFERPMESRQDSLLKHRLHLNQNIAATD